MKELIQINNHPIGGSCSVPAVSAREMYQALGLDKSNWSRWSKKNIIDNSFAAEGQDYQGFVIMTNGNETHDFACALGFAKKLAMQVQTKVGEQVREYFLACETRSQQQPVIDFDNPAQLRGYLLQATEEIEKRDQRIAQQSEKIEEDQPKVKFYDTFCNADGLYGLQNAGRALNQPPKKFCAWLRQEYIFYQGRTLIPYQRYIKQGLFVIKNVTVDGENRPQTYVSPKGLQYFARKLNVEQIDIDTLISMNRKDGQQELRV